MKGNKICLALLGLILSNPVFAAENPVYAEASGTLTVPVVDGTEGPGQYQDVTFAMTESGDWRLTSGNVGIKITEIDTVELIKVISSPVQIFLKISGTFKNGCPSVGHISQRLVENTFEVAVYYRYIPNLEALGCSQALVDFSRTIALPVYGLDAGSYSYIVNGDVLTDNNTGEFSLGADNTL